MKCEQHDYLMLDKDCTCPPEAAREANVSDFPEKLPGSIPKSLDEQRKLAKYAAQALTVAFNWESSGNPVVYALVQQALLSFAESGKHAPIPLKKI